MKILSKFMLPLMATFVLFSCAKEQSTFEVSDIPGRATISGTLTYSTGQDFVNGSFVENFAPAAGVKVLAKISNSSLDNTGASSGYTTYEMVTGADGKYSFSIPAVDNGVSYQIVPQPFYGSRKTVEGFDESNNIKFKESDVVFSVTNMTGSATPGSISIKDAMYGYQELTVVETFDKIETLKGKVGINAYERSEDLYTRGQYWADGKNINVLVKVTYPYTEFIDGSNKSMIRTFGATTNASGNFEVNIPVKKAGTTLKIELQPIAYKAKFVNYYKNNDSADANYGKYMSQELDGVYELNTSDSSADNYYYGSFKGVYNTYTFQTIEGVPNKELQVVMVFRPISDVAEYLPSFNGCTQWGPSNK